MEKASEKSHQVEEHKVMMSYLKVPDMEDDFDEEYLPHRLDEILREIRAKSSGSYLIDGDHSSSYSTSTLAESRCDHLEEDT